MKLRDYFEKYGVKINAFCRSSKISRSAMYSILGGKDPSLRQAIAIEEISDGHVSVRDWVQELKTKTRKSKQQQALELLRNRGRASQEPSQDIEEKNNPGNDQKAL